MAGTGARVLVRADADAAMGTGHVMRCLAVAEALAEREAFVTFAAARLTRSLAARLSASGMAVQTVAAAPGSVADATATAAALADSDALILDGYQFDTDYRQVVAAASRPVLAFDDEGKLADLAADMVVNAAPAAAELGYAAKAPGAMLLLGPAYAPLRREIRQSAALPALPLRDRGRVLVTFGGSDPAGLTGPCTAHLLSVLPAPVGVDMVVGGSNPRVEALRALAALLGERVTLHIDTPDMGTLMRRAGLAVSAGGGTIGELAALCTPTLVVVVADNQAPAATALGPAFAVVDARNAADAVGLVATAASALWDDERRRAAMGEALMAAAVDGQGALRIADTLLARLT